MYLQLLHMFPLGNEITLQSLVSTCQDLSLIRKFHSTALQKLLWKQNLSHYHIISRITLKESITLCFVVTNLLVTFSL